MLPGRTYHLYTHANGSENLFRSDENFRYFLKRYKEFTTRGKGLTGLLLDGHQDLSGLARIQQLILTAKSVN
ncbi:MAG: hypothetical protein ACK5TU_02800 [Cyclobacteriaceae bacterium]